MRPGKGKTSASHLYRHCWNFYWPLAITPVLTLMGMQVFNGILARYPDAERELAVFAYAMSTLFIVEVSTVFLTQTVTVFGRSELARIRVYRFCLGIGLLLALPVVLLAGTSFGGQLLSALYRIEGELLQDVSRYMLYLSPGVILRTHFQYFSGLLTQAGHTKVVSMSALSGVLVSVSLSLFGYNAGWSALLTLVSAQLCSQCLIALFSGAACFRFYRPTRENGFTDPGYRELFRFFWPVCISGMSFGASRPLLYVFVSRTPDAIATIAALRISFDFFMLVQMAINQFRSIIPSMGPSGLREKRRFMVWVAVALTLVLMLCALPPLNSLIFQTMMGLNDKLFDIVSGAILVLLVTPVILAIRNYYHSLLLYFKRTQSMAAGSALRMLTIGFSSALLLQFGWLTPLTAPFVMVLAFTAEMLVAIIAGRAALKIHQADLTAVNRTQSYA